MRTIWILAACLLVSCSKRKDEPTGKNQAALDAVGEIASASVALPMDARWLVEAYVEKESIKIELERESLPGRVAVLTEDLREATANHLIKERVFEEGCKKIEQLQESRAWTEEERTILMKYLEPALKDLARLKDRRWMAMRAADAYIGARRSGKGQQEVHAWYLESLSELTD